MGLAIAVQRRVPPNATGGAAAPPVAAALPVAIHDVDLAVRPTERGYIRLTFSFASRCAQAGAGYTGFDVAHLAGATTT